LTYAWAGLTIVPSIKVIVNIDIQAIPRNLTVGGLLELFVGRTHEDDRLEDRTLAFGAHGITGTLS
jgi:hypothetical protein